MYKRSSLILITLWCLIIILVFRIFYVSSGRMEGQVNVSAGGRFVTGTLYNSKGIIYDRNLVPISGNQHMYYLIIDPRNFDRTKAEYISSLTDIDAETLNNKLKKETPIFLSCYESIDAIDGVTVIEGTGRYAKERVAEHIIGYLDSDLNVGVSGIEKAYDSFLSSFSSTTKYRYYANAVRGMKEQEELEIIKSKESLGGIVLTLDKRLCEISKSIASEYIKKGCVIVSDCNSGEILSLVSLPSYEIKEIYDGTDYTDGQLINNALSRQTVGSVFKAVVAMSALQNGFEKFEYKCEGSILINGHTFMCQNNKKHDMQNLNQAFANSCNCYFISVGQLLGYEKIMETVRLLGLDSSIRIAKDMYSESAILPDDNGEIALANLSIGQGELMISPISISRLFCTLCNGGYIVNPTLYKGTYIDSRLSNGSEYVYKNRIIDSYSNALKQMCIDCVREGTGKNALPEKNGAGGKTASAQTGIYDSNGKEKLNTYFVGFYPENKPEYVITVFASDGKSGSSTCAPVFKKICDFIGQNY